MMTQNTQTKMANQPPVSARTTDLFRRIENEEERVREEFEAERDKYLRLAAEYENYRRRTRKEADDAADQGKRDLLAQLVSLADDLDLALARVNESPEAVADGLQMIRGRFRDILEANSVVAFESEGARFDPERHEAFAVIGSGDRESGTVHEEMRRGYLWKERLFRPALVIVEQ